MLRLALTLYGIVATTLAGTGVILVLVAGHTQMLPIVLAAAFGALTALPVSYLVTRRVAA